MKKSILTSFALMIAITALAQKQVTLTIKHKLGAGAFAFSTPSTNNLGKNFTVTRIDYYISGFTIIHDGGMQTTVPASKYILAKGNSNVIENLGVFSVTNVEGIKFHIGVEAPTNNADPSVWIAPHPLAPQSPSMHWGWSAGYRFIALEGNAGASLSTPYQMHGLGNANYFETTVMAPGVNSGTNTTINLDADYNQALKGIDVSAGPIDHGVNATDLTVLQNFRDFVFSPGAGLPTSISELTEQYQVSVFPNPSTGNVHISTSSSSAAITSATIIDIMGRRIQDISFMKVKEVDLSLEVKGLYFIQLYSDAKKVGIEKLIVE